MPFLDLENWACGDKKGNKPELLQNAILVLLATYHCKRDTDTAAKYINIYINMPFFCLFSFEKHSMAQEKMALVWLGTVACQMLQKVVKLAASCQVTQDPGEDASTRCDSTKLGACTLVISITLSSLQRSDPPRPLQNTWTREGLNPPRGGPFHVNGSLQPETFDVIDHCLFPKTAPNTFQKESQLQLAS